MQTKNLDENFRLHVTWPRLKEETIILHDDWSMSYHMHEDIFFQILTSFIDLGGTLQHFIIFWE